MSNPFRDALNRRRLNTEKAVGRHPLARLPFNSSALHVNDLLSRGVSERSDNFGSIGRRARRAGIASIGDDQSRYRDTLRLAIDGQDAEAYHGLAILELLAHRHERALRAAQRAIELNENFHPAFFALGETQIFMGDFAEGLEPIGHCLRLSPSDPFSPVFVSLVA